MPKALGGERDVTYGVTGLKLTIRRQLDSRRSSERVVPVQRL